MRTRTSMAEFQLCLELPRCKIDAEGASTRTRFLIEPPPRAEQGVSLLQLEPNRAQRGLNAGQTAVRG